MQVLTEKNNWLSWVRQETEHNCNLRIKEGSDKQRLGGQQGRDHHPEEDPEDTTYPADTMHKWKF